MASTNGVTEGEAPKVIRMEYRCIIQGSPTEAKVTKQMMSG